MSKKNYEVISNLHAKHNDDHKQIDPTLSEDIIKYKKILEKEKSELHKIKKDFNDYSEQLDKREKNLKQHIDNIYSLLTTKDINDVKIHLIEQQQQILINIDDMNRMKRDEIHIKKKDLEERLTIRLMDSRIKFEEILKDKITEKEDQLYRLEKLIIELDKVKTNHNNIIEKNDKIKNDNTVIKNDIKQYEKDNTDLKKTLMTIQSNIIKLQEMIIDKKRAKRKHKLKLGSNYISRVEKKNFIDFTINNRESNLKTITDLLSNDEFIRNKPKQANIISLLFRSLDNNKYKINTVLKKIEENNDDEFKKVVYNMIDNFKQNAMNKTWSYSIIFSPTKEERNIIIDTIVNDKTLKELFYENY